MFLGVDNNSGIVFWGDASQGACLPSPILPSPILMPANFVETPDNLRTPGNLESIGSSSFLFREDTFDPITRIRRGRFYKRRDTSQPENCRVMVFPPVMAETGTDTRPLYSYESLAPSEIGVLGDQFVVVLGAQTAFSIWTVISKETIHTREILVSLKSRQSLGALPEINWNSIPDKDGLIREHIQTLLDDIYRAGAESVIDRAREAATAILSAHLQDKGITEAAGKDLGTLIDLLEKNAGKNAKRIIRCAAEIPQRLHSRGKHAEQEKHDNLRPIREQDAELAVQCVGVMLCDLGWGKWP